MIGTIFNTPVLFSFVTLAVFVLFEPIVIVVDISEAFISFSLFDATIFVNKIVPDSAVTSLFVLKVTWKTASSVLTNVVLVKVIFPVVELNVGLQLFNPSILESVISSNTSVSYFNVPLKVLIPFVPTSRFDTNTLTVNSVDSSTDVLLGFIVAEKLNAFTIVV